jgi:hypothetical protein
MRHLNNRGRLKFEGLLTYTTENNEQQQIRERRLWQESAASN